MPAPFALIAAALISATTACAGKRPAWTDSDYFRIYRASLEFLRQNVGVDTLYMDPRPRFLLQEGGSERMTDFNRYGDPAISAAIDANPLLFSCQPDPDIGCSVTTHPRIATVSEIVEMGSQEAGLLASYADLTQRPIAGRELAIRLRFSGGQWRVVQARRNGTLR